MPFTQINSGSTIAGGFNANADTFFELVRQNDESALFQVALFVGGSRLFSVEGSGYQDAHDYVPILVPDTESEGGVYVVDVATTCADAATSITPKIRNITDSADTVVGTPATSTSWATQTLSFAPVVGKEYRVMFATSDELNPCYAIGHLKRTAA